MKTVPVKLVTIVAEAVLQDRLIREIVAIGATGYTVSEATGAGSRGRRASIDDQNVRIESLMSASAADRLLTVLAENYFPDYAAIAWVETVETVRGEKFGLPDA